MILSVSLQSSNKKYTEVAWFGVLLVAVCALYFQTFGYVWRAWNAEVQYSLAFLVPFISGYFVWKQWGALKAIDRKPTAVGLVLIVLAILLHIAGTALDISGPSTISILVLILGCCLFFHGLQLVKAIWFSLAYLVFAVPFPGGVTDLIGFPLQLWASGTTAAVLRMTGMQVTRSGVNLAVPGFEFQVAEACSGMNSLVALVGVTAVFAYTAKLSGRYKLLLFLLAIPVALVANVVRITTIGLVGYKLGPAAATGIYHTWSSPLLFVAAILQLVFFSWIFEKMNAKSCLQKKAADSIENGHGATATAAFSVRRYVLIVSLIAASAVCSQILASKTPQVMFSPRLSTLPLQIDTWKGRDLELTQEISKALNADTIINRQYNDTQTGMPIGLLAVYRKYGRRDFAHRPELCYPAAGWEIIKKDYTTVRYNGKDIQARLVIAQKDRYRDVILYWFASGDRTEANFAKQQLWMALDRVQPRKYGWAFIRINAPVIYSDEDTLSQARLFMECADKPFVSLLTGKRP